MSSQSVHGVVYEASPRSSPRPRRNPGDWRGLQRPRRSPPSTRTLPRIGEKTNDIACFTSRSQESSILVGSTLGSLRDVRAVRGREQGRQRPPGGGSPSRRSILAPALIVRATSPPTPSPRASPL